MKYYFNYYRLITQGLFLGTTLCTYRHCPPDTGLEVRARAIWVRARYLSVTEGLHNTESLRVGPDYHSGGGSNLQAPARQTCVITTTPGPAQYIYTQ